MTAFDQRNLSESLLLIQEVGTRPREHPSFYYNENAELDLRMLNLIATCLTTGRSDNVAAAFDKSNGIRLILAKAGPVLPIDLSATTEFLTTLTKVEQWVLLLPFLVRHTKDNMENRVRRFHESVVEVFDELLAAAADYSLDLSMKREFPRSGEFREKYPDGLPPTLSAMLLDLIHSCRDESVFDLSVEAFLELYIIADTFRRSRFMRKLTDGQPLEPQVKEKIERLRRRLGDICQYDRLGLLIKRVRQVGCIPFRWLGDEFAGVAVPLELSPNAQQAVERQMGIGSPRQVILTKDFINRRLPRLTESWELKRLNVHPRVHAELRIILHLSLSLQNLPPHSSWTFDSIITIPIGSNRPTCICCQEWIRKFTSAKRWKWGLKWVPNDTFPGKLVVDWAYPAPVDSVDITSANESVKKWVDRSLDQSTLGSHREWLWNYDSGEDDDL